MHLGKNILWNKGHQNIFLELVEETFQILLYIQFEIFAYLKI
jgi:hypothetical protein